MWQIENRAEPLVPEDTLRVPSLYHLPHRRQLLRHGRLARRHTGTHSSQTGGHPGALLDTTRANAWTDLCCCLYVNAHLDIVDEPFGVVGLRPVGLGQAVIHLAADPI